MFTSQFQKPINYWNLHSFMRFICTPLDTVTQLENTFHTLVVDQHFPPKIIAHWIYFVL